MKGSLAQMMLFSESNSTLSSMMACSASSLKLMASWFSPSLHLLQFLQEIHL